MTCVSVKFIPLAKKGASVSDGEIYILKPKQAVLVLSKETFALPSTVTGIANLRTTLTKSGLLALNVGIIDPFFNGPISTSLINFSAREVPIEIGMSFFRVVFFEHDDTNDHHKKDESKRYEDYDRELQVDAYREFPKNFMDLPELNNRYYGITAWKLLKGLVRTYWPVSIPDIFFTFNI